MEKGREVEEEERGGAVVCGRESGGEERGGKLEI